MTQATRDDFWDICKAFLMWLVILGHCIQILTGDDFNSHPLFKAIYLFHLPVFFFISGYFAYASVRQRGVKALGRAAIRLLSPVFTFGTLLALYTTYQESFSWYSFLSCYICFWFLWSLFECQILGYVISLVAHPVWKAFCLVFPITFCALYPGAIPYADYLSYSWPFFALGMFARYKKFSRAHINNWWIGAILPASMAFLFFKNDWFIYWSPLRITAESFGIALFRFLAAIFSGVLFLALMHQCAAKLRIAKFGTATLGMYVVQCVICSIAAQFDYPEFCSQMWLITCISILVFFTSYYTFLISRKIPLVGTLVYGDLPTRKSLDTRA